VSDAALCPVPVAAFGLTLRLLSGKWLGIAKFWAIVLGMQHNGFSLFSMNGGRRLAWTGNLLPGGGIDLAKVRKGLPK